MFSIGDLVYATSDEYGITDERRSYIGMVTGIAPEDDEDTRVVAIFFTEPYDTTIECFDIDGDDCNEYWVNSEDFKLLTERSLHEIYLDTDMDDYQKTKIFNLMKKIPKLKKKYYKFEELIKGVV